MSSRQLGSRAAGSTVDLDLNATTPLDPRVRDAMLPWLGEYWGNPSSSHRRGRAARQAVDQARCQVAALLGAVPEELVFTSSGSEANNWVVAERLAGVGRRRLVRSSFEHPSVIESGARAARCGADVVAIAPRPDGVVAAEDMVASLDDDTRLVALMLANNELGTLQPVAEVTEVCRRHGIPVLCDAVQAVGKVPVEVAKLGVDYLTIAGHKLYGPLGAAALWISPSAPPLAPLLVGGGQENGRRASTENVPAIVGLGRAAELARTELAERQVLLLTLRQRLEAGLSALPGTVVNGATADRLPNTTSLTVLGVNGGELARLLDQGGFLVSTGAACHSGAAKPSATLVALGHSPKAALGTIRVSLGVESCAAEVDAFLAELSTLVARLRVG